MELGATKLSQNHVLIIFILDASQRKKNTFLVFECSFVL